MPSNNSLPCYKEDRLKSTVNAKEHSRSTQTSVTCNQGQCGTEHCPIVPAHNEWGWHASQMSPSLPFAWCYVHPRKELVLIFFNKGTEWIRAGPDWKGGQASSNQEDTPKDFLYQLDKARRSYMPKLHHFATAFIHTESYADKILACSKYFYSIVNKTEKEI